MRFPITNVNKNYPCQICGKPDWCGTFANEDGELIALCKRVFEGSYEAAPGGGYKHNLSEGDREVIHPPHVVHEPEVVIDALKLAKQYRAYEMSGTQEDEHAKELGVSPFSLYCLRMGYSTEHEAYTFPMRDAYGKFVGIRLRKVNGYKWTIKGSKQGIFLPSDLLPEKCLFVVEGPTDTAAIHTLGCNVSGLPNCNGGFQMIVDLMKRFKIKHMVAIADNDEPKEKHDGSKFYPGQEGMSKLADLVIKNGFSARVIKPKGVKDSRDWLKAGVTGDVIKTMARNAIPHTKGQSYV